MNKAFIFTFIFFSPICCEKEKPVSNSDFELKLEIVHGNRQTSVYNSLLKDSLVVKVTDNGGNPISKAPVRFELKKGNGDISPDWVLTDTLGLAYVNWLIGCNSEYNELVAYVNDSISNKIDSVIFTANASLPNGWGKSCGIEFIGSFKTDFREHNGIIYLANYNMIYTSNDGGISWQEFENMPPLSMHSDIIDIQFNSKGWMYIATEDDGISYTENYTTWNQINNGVLDYRVPTSLLVEDTCLFASFYYSGLYRSTDNGQSWIKLLINGGYSDIIYMLITRHPNGDLYLFDERDNFWHSTDNGDNWDKIDISYEYKNYPIYDLEISQDDFIFIGADDASISKLSPDTYTGELHTYYERNHSSQHVEDIKIIDDIAYYTVNGNPEPGIYSSQNWDRLDIGFEKQIYTYHLKSDGTFLIASPEGVYYYIEQ